MDNKVKVGQWREANCGDIAYVKVVSVEEGESPWAECYNSEGDYLKQVSWSGMEMFDLIHQPPCTMSLGDYNRINDSGMMYVLYPDFTGVYVTDTGRNLESKGGRQLEGVVKDVIVEGTLTGGEGSAWDSQEGGNHYKEMGVQPLELTLKNKGYEAFAGACYCKVSKYIGRDKEDLKEDLGKAKHVIDIWLEVLEGEDK
jgi:hypothetical protein